MEVWRERSNGFMQSRVSPGYFQNEAKYLAKDVASKRLQSLLDLVHGGAECAVHGIHVLRLELGPQAPCARHILILGQAARALQTPVPYS
jgi:hypothetical protein